jgi:hypothetical protein
MFTHVLSPSNPNLERALFNGRFYLSEARIRGGIHDISNPKFGEYFGVYDEELRELLEKQPNPPSFANKEGWMEQVKFNYCGFLTNTDTETGNDVRSCAPESLFRYLQVKMFRSFTNPQSLAPVKELFGNPTVISYVESLLAGVS